MHCSLQQLAAVAAGCASSAGICAKRRLLHCPGPQPWRARRHTRCSYCCPAPSPRAACRPASALPHQPGAVRPGPCKGAAGAARVALGLAAWKAARAPARLAARVWMRRGGKTLLPRPVQAHQNLPCSWPCGCCPGMGALCGGWGWLEGTKGVPGGTESGIDRGRQTGGVVRAGYLFLFLSTFHLFPSDSPTCLFANQQAVAIRLAEDRDVDLQKKILHLGHCCASA